MRTQRRSGQVWAEAGLDDRQIMSAVCKFFCDGKLPSEITALIKEQYGVRMSREMPYKYLAKAAARRYLRFVPQHDFALEEQITARFGRLTQTKVVPTAVGEHVAYEAAVMLRKLLCTHRAPPYNKKEVHVGFAGGHSMRRVAQALAELLRVPSAELPETVVFHAMVAGFNVNEPQTDPNAFFTYFADDPAIQIEPRFVGLHAPAMVRTSTLRDLRELPVIRDAFAGVRELDIIVTAAASWADGDSLLKKYMAQSARSMSVLNRAGCRGDIMWRPLAPDGPIREPTDIRAMTLMELEDLPGFIGKGKHVLLCLGPCEACGKPRPDILEVVLEQKERLITHLVVDSRSAMGLLGGPSAA